MRTELKLDVQRRAFFERRSGFFEWAMALSVYYFLGVEFLIRQLGVE